MCVKPVVNEPCCLYVSKACYNRTTLFVCFKPVVTEPCCLCFNLACCNGTMLFVCFKPDPVQAVLTGNGSMLIKHLRHNWCSVLSIVKVAGSCISNHCQSHNFLCVLACAAVSAVGVHCLFGLLTCTVCVVNIFCVNAGFLLVMLAQCVTFCLSCLLSV